MSIFQSLACSDPWDLGRMSDLWGKSGSRVLPYGPVRICDDVLIQRAPWWPLFDSLASSFMVAIKRMAVMYMGFLHPHEVP